MVPRAPQPSALQPSGVSATSPTPPEGDSTGRRGRQKRRTAAAPADSRLRRVRPLLLLAVKCHSKVVPCPLVCFKANDEKKCKRISMRPFIPKVQVEQLRDVDWLKWKLGDLVKILVDK